MKQFKISSNEAVQNKLFFVFYFFMNTNFVNFKKTNCTVTVKLKKCTVFSEVRVLVCHFKKSAFKTIDY